jgi:STIP1 family protein 1
MRDPVCNEYGNSYSRKPYLAELTRNGKMDPLLGKPIRINILYANVNLKKAIETFLEKNPWAYD